METRMIQSDDLGVWGYGMDVAASLSGPDDDDEGNDLIFEDEDGFELDDLDNLDDLDDFGDFDDDDY